MDQSRPYEVWRTAPPTARAAAWTSADAVRLAGGHQEWIDEGVGWVASSPPGLQSSSPGLQKEF